MQGQEISSLVPNLAAAHVRAPCLQKQTGTDFSSWSVDQIKEFLDQRGGDYDDCKTLEQLVCDLLQPLCR